MEEAKHCHSKKVRHENYLCATKIQTDFIIYHVKMIYHNIYNKGGNLFYNTQLNAVSINTSK